MSIQCFTKYLDAIHFLTLRTRSDLSVGRFAHSFRLCIAMFLRTTIELTWHLFQSSASNLLTREHLIYLLSFYTDQLPTINRCRLILSRILPITATYYPALTEEPSFCINFQLSSQQRGELLKCSCNLWTRIFLLDTGTLRIGFLRKFIDDLYNLSRVCQSSRLSQSNSLSFLLIIQEHFFLPLGTITSSFRDLAMEFRLKSLSKTRRLLTKILISDLLL